MHINYVSWRSYCTYNERCCRYKAENPVKGAAQIYERTIRREFDRLANCFTFLFSRDQAFPKMKIMCRLIVYLPVIESRKLHKDWIREGEKYILPFDRVQLKMRIKAAEIFLHTCASGRNRRRQRRANTLLPYVTKGHENWFPSIYTRVEKRPHTRAALLPHVSFSTRCPIACSAAANKT